MSDNPTADIKSLLQFFQSTVTERPEATRRGYRQALTAFRSYLLTLPEESFQKEPLDNSLIADWCINMYLSGLTPKTISQYLNVISALYGAAVKEGRAEATDAFTKIKEALSKIDWTKSITEEEFQRLQKVTKSAPLQKGNIAIATDLLLLSLLQGARPISDLTDLRRNTTISSPSSDLSDSLGSSHSAAPADLSGASQLSATEADLDIYNLEEYNPEIADEIEALIERRSDPRRKYIFDLNQSRLTTRQLEKHVNTLLLDLFRLRNIPVYLSVKTTIDSYWAYAALRAGVPAVDILTLLGYVPAGLPILSLAPASTPSSPSISSPKPSPSKFTSSISSSSHITLSAASTSAADTVSPSPESVSAAETVRHEVPKYRQLAINEVVASVFIENPLRWYAMKLRPYIKFDELAARFSDLQKDGILKTPDIFYPYEEIAKKIGKKLVFDKKPVIRDIVFFRSRVTDIYPMFTKIGDLAWCYTTQGKTGKTYAAIPNSSFMVFQKTIGFFTPDYKVAPIGALAPLPGEKIVIIGGLFNGTTATFTGTEPFSKSTTDSQKGNLSQTETIIPETGTPETTEERASILYRLNFISDNGIEWRINVDSRQTAR